MFVHLNKVFDRPNEFLPERWLDGHKGRTDVQGEVGDKLGVPILTFGAGRRVCPGIDSEPMSGMGADELN